MWRKTQKKWIQYHTWSWKAFRVFMNIKEPISKFICQVTRMFSWHYFFKLFHLKVQWIEGICKSSQSHAWFAKWYKLAELKQKKILEAKWNSHAMQVIKTCSIGTVHVKAWSSNNSISFFKNSSKQMGLRLWQWDLDHLL